MQGSIYRPPKSAFMGPPPPPLPEPDTDDTFSILYSDSDLAVVAKSGNLPCHPSGRYRTHTLETLLCKKAGFQAVHFVSRLDRETSGAVLVAKSKESASFLGRAMMARRIHKSYLCVVEGEWTLASNAPDGWIDVYGDILPVGDAIVHKYRKFIKGIPENFDPASSTSAHTRFRPLRWSDFGASDSLGASITLLECSPVTGRTHQIRATLFGLGYKVLGDKLYGADRAIYARMCQDALTSADRAQLRISHQALHAWKVSFPRLDGQLISVTAPPDALIAECGLQA